MKNKGDISQEAKYVLFISPYFIDGLEISPVLGLKLHKMKKKDSVSEGSKALVILIRLTSKRPCQDKGGLWEPPHLSWLWSKFWLKNHVFLIADINSNLFGPFSECFSKTPK